MSHRWFCWRPRVQILRGPSLFVIAKLLLQARKNTHRIWTRDLSSVPFLKYAFQKSLTFWSFLDRHRFQNYLIFLIGVPNSRTGIFNILEKEAFAIGLFCGTKNLLCGHDASTTEEQRSRVQIPCGFYFHLHKLSFSVNTHQKQEYSIFLKASPLLIDTFCRTQKLAICPRCLPKILNIHDFTSCKRKEPIFRTDTSNFGQCRQSKLGFGSGRGFESLVGRIFWELAMVIHP